MIAMKKLGITALVLTMVVFGVLATKVVSCSEGSEVNTVGEQILRTGTPIKLVSETEAHISGENRRLVPEGSEMPSGGVMLETVYVLPETQGEIIRLVPNEESGSLGGILIKLIPENETPAGSTNIKTVFVPWPWEMEDPQPENLPPENLPPENTSPLPDPTPPGVPTGLTATAVSTSQINLDWDDSKEADLAKYRVYRSTTTGIVIILRASETLAGSENFHMVEIVSAENFSKGGEPVHLASDHFTPSTILVAETMVSNYSDTGLSASTTYCYRVTAVDTSGNESSPSNEASATTLALNTAPPEDTE